MNGVHDMGGMDGFGPIPREENEPVFHADWERRAFAIALAMMGGRHYNVDEFRRTIERMPPAQYLASTYYERWLHAIESLLIEKGVIGREQIDATVRRIAEQRPGGEGSDAPVSSGPILSDEWDGSERGPQTALSSGAMALRRDRSFKPRFKVGERVITRNMNPAGHTRIPRYVRGRHGVVRYDWGVFVFPDTHAHGLGANPQHCYAVEFSAGELWGEGHPANERVYVDLWEAYLEHDRVEADKPASRKSSPRKPASISQRTKKAAFRSRRSR